MKQVVSQAIVLARTNYQEADRIVTLLTPDQGKVRVLAKGARKSKSKLAGGIELFCVSEIGFIRGKGELCTLTSSRLLKHYQHIVTDINRTMLGYDCMKLLNKVTEDEPGREYFELFEALLGALNQPAFSTDLIKLWFQAQLLRLAGHSPNLRTNTAGISLNAEGAFVFSFDDMAFAEHPDAPYHAGHVKLLRLVFAAHDLVAIQHVQGTSDLVGSCLKIVEIMLPQHIRA